MAQYIINGPCKDFGGRVTISGSKNSSLPIMAAALLSSEESVLRNVPILSDTAAMSEIIRAMGCEVYRDDKNLIHISADLKSRPKYNDYPLFSRLSASVLVMAPCLARFGRVRIPLPAAAK